MSVSVRWRWQALRRRSSLAGSALGNALNLRNFYGTLQVNDTGEASSQYRSLFNGTIQHGVQFLAPDRSHFPTTYYGPDSGAAAALKAVRNGPVRVGMVGLGVGTFAAYADPNDVFRFYEINPEVIEIANNRFRYLRECRGKVEVVAGDARLSLEREPPQKYNLLAVDAFSGDSIPDSPTHAGGVRALSASSRARRRAGHSHDQ